MFYRENSLRKHTKLKKFITFLLKLKHLIVTSLLNSAIDSRGSGMPRRYAILPLPKSVKCGDKHLSQDCSLKGRITPKCANCGQGHPATYRGCSMKIKQIGIQANLTITGLPRIHNFLQIF